VTAWLIVGLALAQTVDPEAAARKAVDDFHARRYAEAREGFRFAVKYAPKNAGLWAYLGLSDGNLNDIPAAISDLEKARSLSPADPQILFNLGLFYGKSGNQEKSRERYREGLQVQPDDPGANQNYALLLMQAGLCEQAIAPLERLRKLQPLNPSVRVSLLECQVKAGHKSEAEVEARSFLEAPGVTVEQGLKMAAVLTEDGAGGAAEIVLTIVTGRYDESAEAHAGLGKLLLDRGEYEEAVRQLGRAAQLQPNTAGYALGLAEALLLWKHYAAAVQFLEAIRPKFGTLPDFRYKLGLASYALYRYPQALAEFEALLKDRPQADSAWYFLGNTWLAMGKLDNAEEAYHKAIGLNPKVAGYYAALGELLRRSEANRVSEATAALKEAIRLDPSDYLSKKELALCEEREGHLDEAAAQLEEVIRGHPGYKEAHVAFARVCYKLHRKEDGDREKRIVVQLEAEERVKQSAIRSPPQPK